jgi:CDP-diglyceride synthetase
VYRATPFILTSILLIMILPFKELSSIQNMNVGLIVVSTILFIDGILLIIEGFRNLPDAGSRIAKTGAMFFFIVGVGVLIFGISVFTEYNPFENKTSIEIVTILSIILGITVLVQFTAIFPFIFQKRNLAHLLKSGF